VSMRLLAVVVVLCGIMAAAAPPMDFQAFKEWLDNASIEEKTEHFESMSENFIA
jgi:hypothetical protein